MAKAIKLNITPEFDFSLIGIVSSEPIYRISWLLNEKLGLQLTENSHLQLVHLKSKTKQEFSLFTYTNEESGELFDLIQNKSANGVLIDEQKSMDFFLKITDSVADIQEILTNIKEVKNINLAINIQPGSLKSRNRLIFFKEDS